MIRVLVVDDHEIFSDSLARLLDTKADLEVVGTAGTVAAALGAIAALEPDVVLMDFHLPDGDGPEATRQLRALRPSSKVIMLTARSDEQALTDALAAGCAGFVRKEDGVDNLLAAIVAAHEGELVDTPRDLLPLLRKLAYAPRGVVDLTPREVEILTLSAAGMANKEIAEKLGVRLNTIRNHVQKILGKLGAHSRLEAVAIAVREGILAYPEPDGRSGDDAERERAID
jgi:DNA-binding NarL/FixJ family response regulator